MPPKAKPPPQKPKQPINSPIQVTKGHPRTCSKPMQWVSFLFFNFASRAFYFSILLKFKKSKLKYLI